MHTHRLNGFRLENDRAGGRLLLIPDPTSQLFLSKSLISEFVPHNSSNERSSMSEKSTLRLTAGQVEGYRREGFIVYDDPVFPQQKFDALKAHFEEELALLPSM